MQLLRPRFQPLHCLWAYLLVLPLIAGCQGVSPTEPGPPALPPPPPLPVDSAEHYVIDSEQSELRILVYRGGPLARYGHNHVVRATPRGDVYLAEPFHDAGLALVFAVAGFKVDPPQARLEEGEAFAKLPSPQAVKATRENLLGVRGLDVDHYPDIHVRSVAITGPSWGPDITVRIRLRGVERELTVPVAITYCGNKLIATGSFTIRQSHFGIDPLSVLGGGITVKDKLKLRFRIVANSSKEER